VPTQRQRCANPDCPTYEWAKLPSAYCSRACGWAVARARFIALDAAARNALAAPANAADADLQRQLAETDAALRRCAQQLEQLAADEAAYEAQLTAAADAPKLPGKVGVAQEHSSLGCPTLTKSGMAAASFGHRPARSRAANSDHASFMRTGSAVQRRGCGCTLTARYVAGRTPTRTRPLIPLRTYAYLPASLYEGCYLGVRG